MNKFILYYTSGDGCTYSCDVNLPILGESKEHLECELLDVLTLAKKLGLYEIIFHGHSLRVEDFYYKSYTYNKPEIIYDAPIFFTIDEWFTNAK